MNLDQDAWPAGFEAVPASAQHGLYVLEDNLGLRSIP